MPSELYCEVLELTTAIAQPNTLVETEVDLAAAEDALSKLGTLFERREATGARDPFLTETLADFTTDDLESIRLYRLSLQQCDACPGEPTHTKRQGLVERLIQIGEMSEANEELVKARREAFAAGDTEAIRELNALEPLAATCRSPLR